MIIRSVPGIEIAETAHIEVDELIIGKGTIIRDHVQIYGKRVVLGRECFIDEHAVIGGGSASEGELHAGDWLHLGMYSQINTARRVSIGDEVGIGIGTRIFTHGAYLSEWDGFPVDFADVAIGSRVWLPNALVMPGVTIGSDAVVAAGSTITRDIPSGSLSGGTPAKVIGQNRYPQEQTAFDRLDILGRICEEINLADEAMVTEKEIFLEGVVFDIERRRIIGGVSEDSERLKNQLRRHGIRFRYEAAGETYKAWD